MSRGELKRSLTIAGHRTSVSLEPEFWSVVKRMAAARAMSQATLIAEIDQSRGAKNLSSAIRISVLAWLEQRAAP